MTEQPEIAYEVINDSEVEIEGDVKAPPPSPTPQEPTEAQPPAEGTEAEPKQRRGGKVKNHQDPKRIHEGLLPQDEEGRNRLRRLQLHLRLHEFHEASRGNQLAVLAHPYGFHVGSASDPRSASDLPARTRARHKKGMRQSTQTHREEQAGK